MPFARTIRRWRCASCGCPSARHFTLSVSGRRVLRASRGMTPCAVCPARKPAGYYGRFPACPAYRAEPYEETRRW